MGSSEGNPVFDAKIEPDNLIVREEIAIFMEGTSGYPTIDQICSIFDYYMNGDNRTKSWLYINDPRGIDWAYANESIQIGKKVGHTAAGDCDDFAIVMSALVESIGGTSRIVLGINPNESHAFAEVYLGRDNGQDSRVESIVNWLMFYYGTNKIYTHVDAGHKGRVAQLGLAGEPPWRVVLQSR
jgi:transglutaminase-like putative cysteine protease